MKNLIVIAGPTASGKTDLAIEIAQQINGAVVSADSRQVYRGMNIGTGKPTDKTLTGNEQFSVRGIPHYLFDVVEPDEDFTMAHFKARALAAIEEIHAAGKVPMLVGGTGLYIRSIVENLEIPAVPPNTELRDRFEAEYALSKKDALQTWGNKLRALDPAADIDFQNPRRVIRAIEIVTATGIPLDEAQKKGPQLFATLELGIEVEREELYARIDKRVDAMVASGLENEVRGLLELYPGFFSFPASESPGYTEWKPYLTAEKELNEKTCGALDEPRPSREELVESIKFNTHAYARRQMTWFNKNKNIKWVKNKEEAEQLITDFLK